MAASHFELSPLATKNGASFGAVVTDVALTELSDAGFDALYAAWLEYALLIFPGQHLTNEQQTAFARRFGELEFNLAPISNVRKDGTVRDPAVDDDVMRILKGNMGWHADSTYMAVQAKGAVFTAHVVPSAGGQTGWADMRAAYEALPDDLKEQVANLSAYHSLHYSQERAGFKPKGDGEYSGYGFHDEAPPLRPLVKVHPETGRPSLLIGRHAYGIPSMTEEASRVFLDTLLDLACQPPRVYHHSWQPGDAVIWDNRCLLHQACPWDMAEPRVMYHARIAGDPATEGIKTAGR